MLQLINPPGSAVNWFHEHFNVQTKFFVPDVIIYRAEYLGVVTRMAENKKKLTKNHTQKHQHNSDDYDDVA